MAAGAALLVVTDELEAEYRRAVEHPKVRRYAAEVDRQRFVTALVAAADRVEPGSATGAVPADPGDDMVVAAAAAGRAAFLVTLDRHLLSLSGPQAFQVLRPGDFLQVLLARH